MKSKKYILGIYILHSGGEVKHQLSGDLERASEIG
jgi:hypothetical protein